jgi:hypothetical protein
MKGSVAERDVREFEEGERVEFHWVELKKTKL